MGLLARRREGPGSALDTFRREMDRLFEDFFGSFPVLRSGEGLIGVPTIDVAETDKEIEVHAELPGVRPEDVSISIVDDVLTIKGEKKVERETENRQWHAVERAYGAFSRSVSLPAPVDPDKARASYKDGVLSIVIPKRPEVQPRKIEIKVEK